MTDQPPIGIPPHRIWLDALGHPPSLSDYRQRFDDVADCLERYREAGWWQPVWLLDEVGIKYGGA